MKKNELQTLVKVGAVAQITMRQSLQNGIHRGWTMHVTMPTPDGGREVHTFDTAKNEARLFRTADAAIDLALSVGWRLTVDFQA